MQFNNDNFGSVTEVFDDSVFNEIKDQGGYHPPPGGGDRITSNGENRITSNGDQRVTSNT